MDKKDNQKVRYVTRNKSYISETSYNLMSENKDLYLAWGVGYSFLKFSTILSRNGLNPPVWKESTVAVMYIKVLDIIGLNGWIEKLITLRRGEEG